jgi:predicted DCC family thiol-disulfide oxidoreductase YuxK
MNTATLFYDASRPLCARFARSFKRLLAARGFRLLPLQTPGTMERLDLPPELLVGEMRVLREDGAIFGGPIALVEISRHFWWTYPFYLLTHLPGVKGLLARIYRWIAARRTCHHTPCARPNNYGRNPVQRTPRSAFLKMP